MSGFCVPGRVTGPSIPFVANGAPQPPPATGYADGLLCQKLALWANVLIVDLIDSLLGVCRSGLG
jgi:hypothetical protein